MKVFAFSPSAGDVAFLRSLRWRGDESNLTALQFDSVSEASLKMQYAFLHPDRDNGF